MIDDLNPNDSQNSKLLITFPESKEDHRLQLVGINDSIFAIIHSPLESQGPIQLLCEDWSLVLLAPVKSKSDILISAINVICLSEITSEEGSVDVQASNRLVKFVNFSKPSEKVTEKGERGQFIFADDPAILLNCYRSFSGIVGDVRNKSPESISNAQQRFIGVLCALADKMNGNSEHLDFQRVLDIWKIAPKF